MQSCLFIANANSLFCCLIVMYIKVYDLNDITSSGGIRCGDLRERIINFIMYVYVFTLLLLFK